MNKDGWRGDSPVGLRRFGREFITVGHDALAAHRKRYPPTALERCLGEVVLDAIYYNFLHGVELGLKSYLRHIDVVPLQDLRHPSYGHDLCRLLDRSIKHHFLTRCPKLNTTHIEVIRCSNELYKSKQFEYLWIGAAKYLTIDAVAEAAETLITELEQLRMQPAKEPVQAAR